ncbi:Plasmid maintenance system antidote protein, XRE family [Candidatus Nitrotoga sp. BS]|uniref:HigA family addiction module antitoxin n=1 Tax=Candidatus Nitrotoga sp. BS TaxID=2890408 RepID=UPI001EF3B511|nr:HigA family addiction module antitoxin [Candidatus Nitrotoga sp. BS]CAH1197749.1 Plasmid maintenance system antidote protein, XRE family [Candidatus Nitrotoga sp. BS]
MMTETAFISDLAIPPGEYLEEVLEDVDISQAELARRMGRPPQAINEIVKGEKAITPETALQLEQVLGVSAQFWSKLETEYRLILAKKQQLEEIKTEENLLCKFPYLELSKLNLVKKTSDKLKKVISLRVFFGVSSLNNIRTVKEFAPAFRQHEKNTVSHESLASWLRAGHRMADDADVELFCKEKLKFSIAKLRALTNIVEPNELIKEIKKVLAECGVVLALAPTFPRSYTTGATFWLNNNKAVIMMSLRGAWSDIFWFSLFHEIGHILLHDKRVTFLENGKLDPQYQKQEKEADTFAQTALIPVTDYNIFLSNSDFSSNAIKAFADTIGIFPGIITGRLQHDRKLLHTIHYHRVRYKWNV